MYTLLVTGDVPGAATYFNPLLQQTVVPCTSGTRPSASLPDGMMIYETDTKLYQVWNPSAGWIVVLSNRPLRSIKGGDEGRSSTTTTSADTGLSIASVPGSRYYKVDGMVSYVADPAADMKGGLYGPSGAIFTGAYLAAPASASAAATTVALDTQGLTSTYSFGCPAGVTMTALFNGIFYSGVGGTFGFQWAQVVSNAAATVVKASSYFLLTPLP